MIGLGQRIKDLVPPIPAMAHKLIYLLITVLMINEERILWAIGLIITSILSIVLFILQKKNKELGYAIIDTQIMTFKEKIEGVKVTYKNAPVTNLRVVLLKIMNIGNVDITEEDFRTPIRFVPAYTPRGGSFIDPKIVDKPKEADPQIIILNLSHHQDYYALKPILLMPSESITIKIVIAEDEMEHIEVKPAGRIEGISNFKIVDFDYDEWGLWTDIMKFIFVPQRERSKN